MNPIAALGGAAIFLGGVAAALLASYSIPENNLYVCFVALAIGLIACIFGAFAIALRAIERHATDLATNQVSLEQVVATSQVSLERVVDLVVDALERRKGMDVVPRK